MAREQRRDENKSLEDEMFVFFRGVHVERESQIDRTPLLQIASSERLLKKKKKKKVC